MEFFKMSKILFSQIHVPGYMDVSSSNPCTRYMEICFFFKFMYPGTWIWENKILGHFEKKGVGAWRQKKNSVLFHFLPTLKNDLNFLKNIQMKVAPWRFESKLFRRGFTFAVALIQNEKIKVERVSILMGHPVYNFWPQSPERS